MKAFLSAQRPPMRAALTPFVTPPCQGWITLIWLLLFSLFHTNEAAAANNPLKPIPAEAADVRPDTVSIELCSEGGTSVCALHNGDCLVYRHYDFDSGVAGFQARIATTHKGKIEIRLDSTNGPLMGICSFDKTKSWKDWESITCKTDHSQAGVRDIFLTFRSTEPEQSQPDALINLAWIQFVKSIVDDPAHVILGSATRVDAADSEPQATRAWGIPENGFTENFATGYSSRWTLGGMIITSNSPDGTPFAASLDTNFHCAFTPNAYINKTDIGGEWRTLAEGSLAADLILNTAETHAGVGFTSADGRQWIGVTLNAAGNSLEAWRQLADGPLTIIKQFNNTNGHWQLQPNEKFRLQIDWSPYSDGLIAFLSDNQGKVLTSFRTAIDLPAARRPMVVGWGGPARFANIRFDPSLDSWNFAWQWKKAPILTHDVCNPAVWKWTDGKYYMMWRKFGRDTYHGIASSTDGVHWARLKDDVLKCTGDMNVLVNPFGDGLVYVTPGGENMPWWTSDGSNRFTAWTKSSLTLGSIFNNNRIQEIIDTKQYPQMHSVSFAGANYRFIAFTENWTDSPQPHTVILLSNTLTNWVVADPSPLIPPGTNFWGEKGNAIGSAFVLPDGNILVASCSCTFEGYTGAPEPSNVSAIVSGAQPWRVLKLGVLPDAPISRENVWYEGPNFGTAYYYDAGLDTLFFYGGFHDYHIGVMRVENFSKSWAARKKLLGNYDPIGKSANGETF
jgi:hypothetical protein